MNSELLLPKGENSYNATPVQQHAGGEKLQELRALIKLSWPVALASFFVAAIDTSDTAFIGHIGTDELTGAGLAYSWTEFLGVFVWSSAYALNSLCAQSVGAGNPKLAGSWLQLALALVALLAVPVTCAQFFFTGSVLTMVCDHKGSLSRAISFGQLYNKWAAMTLLPSCIYMALTQYFQALEVVKPATIVSALAVCVNLVGNQLLIWGVREGGRARRESPPWTLPPT